MGILAVVVLCQTFAGSQQENYLRYLQTVRLAPLYPWGVRTFAAPSGWLPVSTSIRFNSGFPYGYNDGAIWAGRGATLAAEGGAVLRRGVLTLTLAPMAFVAQNTAFSLATPTALDSGIDRPQRFGTGAYARLDPGQSSLRLDWRALALGISTANEYWGPATDFPIILGDNAAGFPHAFLGTAHPVALGPLRAHGRILWGTLSGGRFATGVVLDVTSRWVPGLEIGATRFAHLARTDVFAVFKGSERNLTGQNQLASAFFRWVLPNSGFELYGEYGKDDYNASLRDFLLEPDRDGGYTIGFRKAMRREGDRLLAVRAELQNLQLSSLAQGKPWSPFYTSAELRQGHTQLGQVLGSEAGPGGAGSVVAVESYTPRGSWTWAWTRMIRRQRGDSSGTTRDPDGVDVQHALSVERVQVRGRYEVLASVTGVYEFNRNFGSDEFNVNVILGIRYSVR